MASKSLSELRKLQRNQLARINKDELIDIILATADGDGELTEKIDKRLEAMMKEMQALKTAITAPDSPINKNYAELKARVDKQEQIIAKQQQFLETLDRKEREANVVILGVPDENESLEGATTDQEKLNKIWSTIGVSGVVGTHRRLGGTPRGSDESSAPRRRPILLTLQDKGQRSGILDNASSLKHSGDNYKKIYIKKDVHPSIRKEWRRLRDAEAAEKSRPENAGCVIRLDTRERKLYRDDNVIDTWNPQFFL